MSYSRATIFLTLCLALTVTSPAWAGEQTFKISCPKTSQAAFDKAISVIGAAQSDASKQFQDLAQQDPDCTILYWGLAVTSDDPAMHRKWCLEAIYRAAVGDVNDAEHQRIATLSVK